MKIINKEVTIECEIESIENLRHIVDLARRFIADNEDRQRRRTILPNELLVKEFSLSEITNIEREMEAIDEL
jgi:hypothetical protein